MGFAIVLIAVLFSTGFWFWLVHRQDYFSPEPILFLIKIMLIGGLLSTVPSSILNDSVLTEDTSSTIISFWQMLFVGFNEELWKLLATVYLIKSHKHFDEAVDGMIYAATIALGFAAIENILYIGEYGLSVLAVRHFTSVPAHIAFSMLWGYGLSVSKFKHPERHWVYVLWPFYVASSLFHAAYNFSFDLFSEYVSLFIAMTLVISLYRYGSKKISHLLLHSPLRPKGYCSACKSDNEHDSQFCSTCGTTVLNNDFPLLELVECIKCSHKNKASSKFCAQCGNEN